MESASWLPTTGAVWRQLHEYHSAAPGAHGASHGHSSHGHSSHGSLGNLLETCQKCSDDHASCMDSHTALGYVEVTTAIMLFGMFLFNNLVLYCVNRQDENIRDNSYKMLNTTISIFAAVMINASVFAILCEQVIPAPVPWGLGFDKVRDPHHDANHIMYFVIGIFVFCAGIAALNVLCSFFKRNHAKLFAIESITGHLCAFSGIYCFGNVMEIKFFKQHVCLALLVVPMSLLVCLILCIISKKWRESQENKEEKSVHAHHPAPWIHAAQEAEDEAVTLLTSFLISQVVGFAVIGELPAMHHDGLVESQLLQGTNIGYAASLAALLLILGTWLMRKYFDSKRKEQASSFTQRLVPFMHRLVGMSFAWFLYRWLEWHMLLVVPKELHVAHALAAFVALVGAIVGIFILDCFGDKLRDFNKKEKNQEPDPVRKTTSGSGLSPEDALENVRGSLLASADVATDLLTDTTVKTAGVLLGDDKESHLHVEDALRNLIKSIAVFVGLSWEKAFDVAEHTMVTKWHEKSGTNEVLSKVLLAWIVCIFMLPGWYWYILPKARMDFKDHEERIAQEKEQESKKEMKHANKSGFPRGQTALSQ